MSADETKREEWERWSELDDTLADGQGPAQIPAEARDWLAEQRFVHGLLRAANGADADAREARIAAILAVAVPAPTRRWWSVAVAALLLCAIAGAFWLPGNLPSAAAAVQRAAELLGQDVDRRFTFATALVDADGRERMHQEFELTTRPGMRVLIAGSVTFGPLRFDDFRAGCDGTEFWFRAGPEGAMRRTVPLAQADRLLAGMGNALDLGYLDVHALVERLPSTFELRTVGRERGADGRDLLRIEAHGAPLRPGIKLRQADLLVDEQSGMIVRVTVTAEGARGMQHRVAFDYLGTAQLDAKAYQKPW